MNIQHLKAVVTVNESWEFLQVAKASEIRGKSYSQFATLTQLYEDGVLTLQEFNEQKEIILSGLKKL